MRRRQPVGLFQATLFLAAVIIIVAAVFVSIRLLA